MAEPIAVAAVLVRNSRVCSRCRRSFEVSEYVRPNVCGSCVDQQNALELTAWQTARLQEIEMIIGQRLSVAGMQDAELGAELERIPVALKRMMPLEFVKALMRGDQLPAGPDDLRGFGIAGNQGAGKTMAMAALMRSRTGNILTQRIAAQREIPAPEDGNMWLLPASFLWVNWPDRAQWLKVTSMQPGGAQIVESFTKQASHTQMLVVDDLGRERLGKNYDEDFAFGVLDRIIDSRSRMGLALLWTSNLPRKGLATRYGAAMTSRLLGMAPAVELGKMPDLRLSGPKSTTQAGE